MALVQLSYDDMQSTATDIKGYAQQVRDAINALQGDITQLTPTWEGDARKAFDESYASCVNEIGHFPAMLEELHSALVFAATTMHTAEAESAAASVDTVVSDRS
jgi:WXG100 family type VII secretion target